MEPVEVVEDRVARGYLIAEIELDRVILVIATDGLAHAPKALTAELRSRIALDAAAPLVRALDVPGKRGEAIPVE